MYALPAALSDAIAGLVGRAGGASLAEAAGRLSARYREEAGHAVGNLELLAYLAVRLPATYAAARAVFAALAEVDPDFAPLSMLDLGAGPGTVSWAAAEVFTTLSHMVSVERDAGFVALGRSFAAHGPTVLRDGEWLLRDLGHPDLPIGQFDLVSIGFALTELSEAVIPALIRRAWAQATGALVLIEPGTTAGFARLAQIRAELISMGADIAAPCPHLQPCPLIGTGEWCHSAVRLPRSRWHRQIKQSSLGYEDEKFSYLVATRRPIPHRSARLLYPVRVTKASVTAFLCQTNGQAVWREVKIRRKSAYKAARKWVWGQSVPDDVA